MGNVDLPQKNEVKTLGMHLDRRLTWAKYIESKRKQLNLKAKQIHWLLGKSALSTESKLLLYKEVLKPIWTYGIQLWGTASNPNIEILQRFQSLTLRCILNASWYTNNHRIHENLQMNTVLSEIKKWNAKYLSKLENHTNVPADGRAIAQAVSRWLPTAAVRGSKPNLVMWDLWWDKVALGQVFSELFGFPCNRRFAPPITPQSPSCIIRGKCTIGQCVVVKSAIVFYSNLFDTLG
jgi:hypothetical protein